MTTKEVFQKLNENNELALKVKALKTPEEIYAACKELGLTDSIEEFKKAAGEINSSLSKLDAADLDAISGGSSNTITTLTTTTTASAAAAAAI